MDIRWIADGYADDHGGVLRDDVRVVVAERESGGGGGGRVHVLADHLEHVCDGECLVFFTNRRASVVDARRSGCAGLRMERLNPGRN